MRMRPSQSPAHRPPAVPRGTWRKVLPPLPTGLTGPPAPLFPFSALLGSMLLPLTELIPTSGHLHLLVPCPACPSLSSSHGSSFNSPESRLLREATRAAPHHSLSLLFHLLQTSSPQAPVHLFACSCSVAVMSAQQTQERYLFTSRPFPIPDSRCTCTFATMIFLELFLSPSRHVVLYGWSQIRASF